MAATSENFGDLLEPGLRKIFTDVYREKPQMMDMLYNVQSSSESYEKDSSVGSFGTVPEFTGTVSYDDVYQGYDKTYTHKEYAKGFKVQRSLFDDDLYNVISKRPKGLGTSARRTRESASASTFNNAFTSEPTDGDGAELCASDHASNATSTTQSNEGTTALSPTAVETARRLMIAFKDDRDGKIDIMPDLLLVPRDLEETAFEIISSKGKVDSADNNANFHFGKYKLAVWDYLTDSNNWFLIDQDYMKIYLQWFDRIPLEFNQDKDFDTYIAKFSCYMRYSFSWSDWRWIYGQLVT